MQNSENATDLVRDTSDANVVTPSKKYISDKLNLRIRRFFQVLFGICVISLIFCGYMIDRYSQEIISNQKEQLKILGEQIEAHEKALASSSALVKSLEDQIANKDNLIFILETKAEIQDRLIKSLEERDAE